MNTEITTKKLSRVAILTLLLVTILFFIYNGNPNDFKYDKEVEDEKVMVHNEGHEHAPMPYVVPEKVESSEFSSYWTGLDITPGNHLFVLPDYSSQTFVNAKNTFVNEVLYFTRDDWTNHDKIDAVFDKYYKILGINGILDALLPYWKVADPAHTPEIIMAYESYDIHHWGKYAATKTTNRRYAIEVCSRDIFLFATLHGVVWESIENFENIENNEAVFEFVRDELCYFKNYENMANTYMACVHGVGHGFALIYGGERVDKSIDICGLESSYDVNYGCGGGVYMELILQHAFHMTKESYYPCDELDFPASCFRFVDLHPFTTTNNPYPCEFIKTKYHKVACVWAEGYHTQNSLQFAHNFCSKYLTYQESDEFTYYRACADGYFNVQIQSFARSGPQICSQFIDPYTKDLCIEYATVLYKKVSNQLTITSDDDDFRWNYALLEEFRYE